MSRILANHCRVVERRRVVEIQPYRRRGKQHIDGDVRRCRSRDPRAAIEVNVLAPAVAVINLVARIINVIILHSDSGFDNDSRRSHVHTTVTRFFNVPNATRNGSQRHSEKNDLDFGLTRLFHKNSLALYGAIFSLTHWRAC